MAESTTETSRDTTATSTTPAIPSAPPAAPPAPDAETSPTPTPPSNAAARPKRKSKPRRKGRRRDGEDSDAGSDSATVASSARPMFPDTNSTTPLAWADSDPKGDVVEFNQPRVNGESTRGRGRAGAVRGGRGGKVSRELIDVDQTKVDERAQQKKERQKAKRNEKRKDSTTVGDDTSKDVESLAVSTSALTLDNTSRNRAANPQRAEDPKVTPRVGGFWMHDQRHYASSNDKFNGPRPVPEFWRGRGGPRGMPRGSFRGAPRGRGRGFAPFAHVPHVQPPVNSDGPRMAEMDKLEIELAQQRERQKRVAQSKDNGRWGHEGFDEHVATEDSFRANRAVRGRGRARGAVRGGVPRAFVPARLPTPEASPDRGKSSATEMTATQSVVESLMEDTGAVTIRLPGEANSVAVEAPKPAAAPAKPTSPAPKSAKSASPGPPVFVPSNPSPLSYVASDSGSMSSGHVPPVPQAVGMTPNGELYPLQTNFRPPPGPGFYPLTFAPQSFTPEPGMQPLHQRAYSGGPFFPQNNSTRPRSASPLNPYATYFVPPRPLQKTAMRPVTTGSDDTPKSPSSDATDSNHGHGIPVEGYMQPFYYNPYAGGMTDAQGMFYPAQNGYWPQPGYEAGYGYEGEYHGY